MRIGIDVRMWGPEQTGIGRFIDRLMHHLIQMPHRHEFTLFALESRASMLVRRLESAGRQGIAPRVIPVRDRWYGWGEQVRFPRIVRDANLDLLHVPHFNVPLGYRRPFVVTIHDATPWVYPGHNMGRSALRRFLFRRVFRSACRRAKRLMAVSEATRQDILRFAGSRLIDVVHEGPGIVDVDEVRCFPQQESVVPPVAAPFLFALGVWREHKNFERLIAAFEELKRRGWRDLLLVVGGSWRQGDPSVRRRLQQSPVRNDIITPGFLTVDELPRWYRHARAVVVPSLAEGFGFVGLEAMYAATPVIAARAGSLPEVYEDAAYYIDPQSILSMADGIERVLRDAGLRSILVARGKDQVRRYSWRRMTERIVQIYEEAAQS